jgi:hypothetical protein
LKQQDAALLVTEICFYVLRSADIVSGNAGFLTDLKVAPFHQGSLLQLICHLVRQPEVEVAAESALDVFYALTSRGSIYKLEVTLEPAVYAHREADCTENGSQIVFLTPKIALVMSDVAPHQVFAMDETMAWHLQPQRIENTGPILDFVAQVHFLSSILVFEWN